MEKVAFGQIGKRIVELRNERGLSQSGLAMSANQTRWKPDIGQSYLSTLERSSGDRVPSARTLCALAEALQTSTDYLLGMTDDSTSPADLADQVVFSVSDDVDRLFAVKLMRHAMRMSSSERHTLLKMVEGWR